MQHTNYCHMKKVLFSSLFLLLFTTIEGFSQTTYLYKCIKSVYSDGTIFKGDHTTYFTISGDVMYESDKDGFKLANNNPYKYKETVNGNRIYMLYTPPVSFRGLTAGGWNSDYYLLVSPDNSTINQIVSSTKYVYVRTTEAQVAKEQEQKKKEQYQLIR